MNLSPSKVKKALDNGAVLIDVRTPQEFAAMHIKGSINVPVDYVAHYADEFREMKNIVLVCKSGQRSSSSCLLLGEYNIDADVLEGGLLSWRNQGFEVITGKPVWEIERQVRFIAGLLVCVSILLGFFLSLYWLALGLFVGLGLVFAAVTNTCGMGLLLARMPWNKATHHYVKKELEKNK